MYGVANASKIIGVYLIRGNGTPRSLTLKGGESGRTDPPTGPADYKGVFDVAPDYESYNFTPLDYKTDREFIEKVWSWEGEVEGLTVADGKGASAPAFLESGPLASRADLGSLAHTVFK